MKSVRLCTLVRRLVTLSDCFLRNVVVERGIPSTELTLEDRASMGKGGYVEAIKNLATEIISDLERNKRKRNPKN